MKKQNNAIYLFWTIVFVLVMIGMYRVGTYLNYSIGYEALVEDTIKALVREEALR